MAVISGGRVIEPSTANPGLKNRVYSTSGVPTDTTIGVTAANGMLAQDVTTGNVYERTGVATWIRIDTL